jgi:hypothetical protein
VIDQLKSFRAGGYMIHATTSPVTFHLKHGSGTMSWLRVEHLTTRYFLKVFGTFNTMASMRPLARALLRMDRHAFSTPPGTVRVARLLRALPPA